MKKIMMLLALGFAGCGPSQKDLRVANDLLEKSKTADCQDIRLYLNKIQDVIQSKMK